jgi:ADP-ribose pyrophosphatase
MPKATSARKQSLKKAPARSPIQKSTAKKSSAAKVLSSKLQYEGPLFKIFTDHILEPNGVESTRDVVRHNGSAVVLAIDDSKSKRDPLILMELQYRHAAGQYMWELPAGKIDGKETRLAAAKRELMEETGYRAKKWTPLIRYFASPGFLGEWMQIFLAEGLTLGNAEPEDDERIDLYFISLSEVLRLIDAGVILDGKTLVGVQYFARIRRLRT